MGGHTALYCCSILVFVVTTLTPGCAANADARGGAAGGGNAQLMKQAGALPSTKQLQVAFDQDGFDVQRMVTYNGSRGIEAISRNVTLLSTGAAKRVRYVEGSAFAMGYLRASLNYADTERACTTYIDHFIPSLISWKLDKRLSGNPVFGKLYDSLTVLLGDWFKNKTNEVWRNQSAGVFPSTLIDEMHGIVAGAAAQNSTTGVTFDCLVTLNFGMDWLTATLVTGGLLPSFQEYVTSLDDRELLARVGGVQRWPGGATEVRAAFALLQPDDLDVPVYCDAFAASGAATASGTASYYARSFQLPTANVFQDIQTMVIYHPVDGRRVVVSSTAPGIVGSITAMNDAGYVAGVDTLRSAESDRVDVGINSCLLVRSMVDTAADTAAAIDIASAAKRGCAYLYSMTDASGNGAILETTKWTAAAAPPDTTQLIEDAKLKAALPTASYLAQHSVPDFRNGVYVRNMTYEFPQEFLSFNKGLFDVAGLSQPDASAWGPEGFVFPKWQQEDADWGKIGSKYFSPQREQKQGLVVVSNFAVIPQVRISQMTGWASLFPAHAMQFRYDYLNRALLQAHGAIDYEGARHILTFLEPDRMPGYWNNTLNPVDPMSAQVEGTLSLCDTQARVFETKGGYWKDGWLRINLRRYL